MVLGSSATPWAWDQTWPEASSSGKTAANQVLPKVNKGGKITSRFSNPLTSNASPLYTFDNNTGFNAQLTAPSSNAFVDLFIAPSSTGDLTTVTLRQDTDFDGSFDYAYSVTSPVSGVCANGFISADQGTWTNKHYFTWTADTSGRVTATEVPSLLDLAGCYCINSSCGSNLVWANIGTILKDLGGGIVSAIQNQRTVTITATEVTGTEILYYGQQSSSMGDTTGVYFSGTAHPEQYYAGGGGTLPADSEVLNQASDPDSFYYQLNQLSQNVGSSSTPVQCSITRTVTSVTGQDPSTCTDTGSTYTCSLNSQTYTDLASCQENCIPPEGPCLVHETVSDLCTSIESNPNCKLRDEQVDGVYTYKNFNSTGLAPIPSCKTVTSQQPGNCGEQPNCTTHKCFTDFLNHGECYAWGDTSATVLCSLPLPGGATVIGRQECSGVDCPCPPGAHGGSLTFYLYETCADNYTCSLNSHLYSDLASCIINCTATCVRTVCRDWWEKKRTYLCQNSAVYDFSKAQQRAGHIQNTLNDGDTTMTFQDYNPDTSETTDYSVTLPPREDVERCKKSCRVRVPIEDTQASLTGNTSMYRDTINTFREVLKPCDGDTCPVGSGETLIEGCQCTNYFLQTTSILQVMDDASKDIICSSSPP